MAKIADTTRESWIKSTFPEWGTWLGCTGVWFKTPGGANITIDLWCGN